MSRRCKRLTENQWNAMTSQWIDKVSQSSKKNGKSSLKRNEFVIDWCITNGIPDDSIPHPSSVTRRLRVEEARRQYLSNNKQNNILYYPMCGCTVDSKLMEEVDRLCGDKYKHQGYNDKLCLNCNTKRFFQKQDHAADAYIEQHMLA